MTSHRFNVGDFVKAKNSGKLYVILAQRLDVHPKLKGEVGYSVVRFRDGHYYGAVRLMRDSSFDMGSAS
jgi:hypothetical protein